MSDWQLGLRAFREGRMREAMDRLRAAANDRERTVMQAVRFQTLAFLGAALYALGNSQEAVSAFEDAIRLAPKPGPPADLNVNLANAYLAIGRRDDAQKSLQVALKTAPGHVEARMMLQRLENSSDDQPVAGAVLGETPEGVKTYLRTLSFSRVTSGGYDPAQVRQALSQIERYIDFLAHQLMKKDELISTYEIQIERYKKMEDAYIQKMIETRATSSGPDLSEFATKTDTEAVRGEEMAEQLTPIEKLFRNKR
jgi:tetratricopeptide (TPR) repeat protein